MGEAASLPTVEHRRGAALRMLILLGRLALGGMFLYAAYTKLRQPWMLFAFSVNSYQLLPEWAVVAVARTVPWLELGLGLLLIAGYGLRYAAAGASALLLLFFGVMLRSYFLGLGIDCGCFGLGEKLGVNTLVRDGFLVLLSVALAVLAFRIPRGTQRIEVGQTKEEAR